MRTYLVPLSVLASVLIGSPSDAADLPHYDLTAPSTAHVARQADGSWAISSRTTRFEIYDAIPDSLRGAKFPPRLATITANSSVRGDDRADGRISVTIDDLTGPALRRVTRFSDPGGRGKIEGGLYFVTTELGCCALPSSHHIRALETGRKLFDSTGDGPVGIAHWMQVPNANPTVERWAAFAGALSGKDRTKLGDLQYGDRRGRLAKAELRLKPSAIGPDTDEMALDLASCGFLLWVEPGRQPGPGQLRRPDPDSCRPNGAYAPTSLFSLEHRDPHAALGGFAVELSMSGQVLATIPIVDDALDVSHATLDDRLELKPAP